MAVNSQFVAAHLHARCEVLVWRLTAILDSECDKDRTIQLTAELAETAEQIRAIEEDLEEGDEPEVLLELRERLAEQIRNKSTGHAAVVLTGHTERIRVLLMCPDREDECLSGGEDGCIVLWDLKRMTARARLSTPGVSASQQWIRLLVPLVGVWEDCTSCISGQGRQITVWRFPRESSIEPPPDQTELPPAEAMLRYKGHTGVVFDVAIGSTKNAAANSSDVCAVSAAHDMCIHLWQLHTGVCLQVFSLLLRCVLVSGVGDPTQGVCSSSGLDASAADCHIIQRRGARASETKLRSDTVFPSRSSCWIHQVEAAGSVLVTTT